MTEPLKAKIAEYVDKVLLHEAWEESGAKVADHILRLVAEHQPARSEVKAQELEVDGEAGAWYVRILDEQVHHTTEGAPVNIDWTADGTMVGVEVLGSVRSRLRACSSPVTWCRRESASSTVAAGSTEIVGLPGSCTASLAGRQWRSSNRRVPSGRPSLLVPVLNGRPSSDRTGRALRRTTPEGP